MGRYFRGRTLYTRYVGDQTSSYFLFQPHLIDAAWSLLSFCAYYTNLVDELLKDLLSFYDSTDATSGPAKPGDMAETASPRFSKSENGTFAMHIGEFQICTAYFVIAHARIDTFSQYGGLDASLTHITHPYAFENLHRFLQHMRRFRDSIGSKSKADEEYLLTLETLVDIIDSTALNLSSLDKVFTEISNEINANAGEQLSDK